MGTRMEPIGCIRVYSRQMLSNLPPRLYQLAHLIAAGHINKSIADIMGISEETIRVYSSDVYSRLGLVSWGNSRVRLTQLVLGIPAEGYETNGYQFPIGV